MADRRRQDRAALAIAATRAASARFANDGTRAVLERILDDLRQRIEDRRIAPTDAAAIVDRLRFFCADAPPQSTTRSLPGLRDALDPQRFADRARELARAYVRLTAR
jgi:hypothetical protein